MTRVSVFRLLGRTMCVAVVAWAASVYATVTVPHVIGSNMVLQRGQAVPVWGQAEPGERVTVQFAGQTKSAKADANGHWEVRLAKLAASSTPATMVISGSSTLTLTNILVGEVWLSSGQSNMEKPIGEKRGQKPVLNYQQELASGDHYPDIRLFKAERVMAAEPKADVTGEWNVCSSNSLETTEFSAAAYFFARDIHDKLHVPIGLVESAWGGTRVEPWTPPVGFKAVESVRDLAAFSPGTNKLNNRMPSVLYNGMIAPLQPFAIRGVLWYQGESNCMDVNDGSRYADKFEALIRGWRKVWGEGNFPFYYVQLAPYCYYSHREKPRVPSPESLPEIWEAQARCLRLPNTGMAVITDAHSLKDIHPRDKQAVGKRLALIALAKTYGRKGLVYSGPMFKSMKVKGSEAILSFDHVDGGLISKDGQPLDWFTVAGADQKFVPAKARIQGDVVVVSSPNVPEPKAVRFAWNETAEPNFFNKAGLPASPFRTDDPWSAKGRK